MSLGNRLKTGAHGAALAALCFCAGLWALPIWAQSSDLPESVTLALRQTGIPDTHLGVVVLAHDSTPLLRHGETRAFNPASVMKLLPSLAALDILGPAHTFKTTIKLDGALRDGILAGNLVIEGGGDPGMTPERLWLLLRELRQRGLRHIQGDLLTDNRLYDLPPADPGAFDQAPLRPYNAQPAALLVNYNVQHVRLALQDDQLQARLDPPSAGIALDNRLQISRAECDAILPRLEGAQLILEGRIGTNPQCGDPGRERSLALNLQPASAASADWLRALWAEVGGTLDGQVREGAAGPNAAPWLSFESAPLATLVRDLNKHSNNVMTQMLYLNLGAAQFGAPATWAKAEQALRDWLSARPGSLDKLVLQNGAGLSRLERMTAEGLARLLVWAAREPAQVEFIAALPAVGLEGTQKNRLMRHAGEAWLKTGSLNGVRSLAGYVRGPGGRLRPFVCLINHPQAVAAQPVQDALLDWARQTPDPSVSPTVSPVNQH